MLRMSFCAHRTLPGDLQQRNSGHLPRSHIPDVPLSGRYKGRPYVRPPFRLRQNLTPRPGPVRYGLLHHLLE
ncbi:hypothetical protein BCEN4_450067 [Burkholderia cenocepacia]|nr:hypothetical protein BCEN4_450067 [Burkholderia cenocepacia]